MAKYPGPAAGPEYVAAAKAAAVNPLLLSSPDAIAIFGELAQAAARMRNDNHVGTEHVTLALFWHNDERPRVALHNCGIDESSYTQHLLDEPEPAPEGAIPSTPRAMMIAGLAAETCIQRGADSVSASDVLLGIIAEARLWSSMHDAGPQHLADAARSAGRTLGDIERQVRQGLDG